MCQCIFLLAEYNLHNALVSTNFLLLSFWVWQKKFLTVLVATHSWQCVMCLPKSPRTTQVHTTAHAGGLKHYWIKIFFSCCLLSSQSIHYFISPFKMGMWWYQEAFKPWQQGWNCPSCRFKWFFWQDKKKHFDYDGK